MTVALYFAAFLVVAVSVAHSVLGECYILIRLFRHGGLPKLFGGTEFTAQTLRFAWHITTIAWWGFAAVLVQLAQGSISTHGIALVTGVTFCTTAFLTLAISRARHLAWLVFLFIGGVALYVAITEH